jgi:hypothetical protein
LGLARYFLKDGDVYLPHASIRAPEMSAAAIISSPPRQPAAAAHIWVWRHAPQTPNEGLTVLISEIEPPFNALVVNGILAVFLGSSALLSGCLVLWSDTHSRKANRRLGGLIAAGALLLSSGMAGWNIGGQQLRAIADDRFAALLSERFDAWSETRYAEVKTDLAAGDATVILSSPGRNFQVVVRRTGGVLHFFERGTEITPATGSRPTG